MSDLQTHAAAITAQFSEHLEIDEQDVKERLETVVDEYRIPPEEARRTVRNQYLEEADLDDDAVTTSGNEMVGVGTIETDESWIDVTAKVVELWEPQSEAIAQVGLLGDESGRTKFVSFETSDLPAIDEGEVYRFENVVTDEYQGNYSVKLNRTTDIERLDESIEVGDDTTTVQGALVDIQSGSGLIKRCPEDDCTRVLQNGRCSEHGSVDGEFDLRIKAVLDNGETITEVICNRERTEELTGITLKKAKQMAKDALDTTVVAEEMSEELLGSYYAVSGPELGRYVLADSIEPLGEPTETESVLIEARSI
jgi:replication factor A1